MKHYTIAYAFIFSFGVLFGAGCAQPSTNEDNNSSNDNHSFMIRHTVVFKLKHPRDSKEEKDFLAAAKELSAIEGVKNFECLRQVSKKNNFDFGLSMEFDSQASYDAYSNHPDHAKFVQEVWLRDVEDFLEIDYEPMND
ncbi:MAG TPA: Dabb family protein [Flavitalea sp.]|nr:Dabb family protein [Flavitalea sp.]